MSLPELMSHTFNRLSSLPDTILCLSNCSECGSWVRSTWSQHKARIAPDREKRGGGE